ncbi:MAG: M28 family peptidase [Bacteroidetes bacterium]|nr:M28 family peptidase [Bacteroidota bacterium]
MRLRLLAPLAAVAWAGCQSAAPVATAQRPAAPSVVPGVTPTVFQDSLLAQRYAATITPELLAAHLYTFASDAYEGRETSARGQKLAALYLASQYRRLGLRPMGNAPGTNAAAPERYFQPFAVYGQRIVRAELAATRGGQTVATASFGPGQQNRDAMPVFASAPGATGGVVFGGYGIADSTLGYDDLAALRREGIAVQGKWIVILGDEPMRDASTSLLRTADGKPSRWTTGPFDKIRGLIPAGVAGVLVVGDQSLRPAAPFAERVASAADASQRAVGSLSLNRPAEGAPTRRGFPPVYTVSSAFANALLAGTGQTVEGLKRRIDTSLQPAVLDVPGVTLANAYERRVFEASTENVAAMIEGSDPVLKNEVVVISSHYDHIGINAGLPGEDVINNGADDDGSGTVAVLAMAEAFQRAKDAGFGPRRSILFLNVAGEEKGLLGSAYYADVDPLVPLANTVTNLNIDMIGRFDPTEPNRSENYVYIIGSNLISQELDAINTRANTAIGSRLELSQRFNTREDPNQFYRRSDHWNFGKKGIPFVFYFTGTHEDYHGVGDEPQKIEYPRMARIARLVFGTAWQVANQPNRPAVSGTGFN